MIRRFVGICLVLTAAAVVLGGCAYFIPDPNRPPRWADLGSGAYARSGGRVFDGVGSASNPARGTAMKDAADVQARAAVGRIVGEFVSLMAGEFVRSPYGNGHDGRRVLLALQLSLKVKFPGGEIVERWGAPDGSWAWSLCRLNLADLVETVRQDPRLDDGLKRFFENKAEKIHEMTADRLKKDPVLIEDIRESDLPS